ncbi:LOW QUALITY PROTEIN: sp110 nuclear body protein-like [Chionomys nivalis]|uniref:LOW QUALITY PROTEIN: sp110 nuclear body protein-like n=1 Tax=Chionomys nivalis TaxID=269649 RepID=UPI0025961F09|nr:LOW QUALITY PROTEIN: sp110 nuclear body protein-like [Chionomys nivalis]
MSFVNNFLSHLSSTARIFSGLKAADGTSSCPTVLQQDGYFQVPIPTRATPHTLNSLCLSPEPASFPRILTMTKTIEEVLLQHLIQMKLDIAYVINRPFPFLDFFRNYGFVTEKMYKDSQEACENLVPVSRVAYKVLTHLERTFHPSLLLKLFDEDNLSKYPNRQAIFRSFENGKLVSPKTFPCAVL